MAEAVKVDLIDPDYFRSAENLVPFQGKPVIIVTKSISYTDPKEHFGKPVRDGGGDYIAAGEPPSTPHEFSFYGEVSVQIPGDEQGVGTMLYQTPVISSMRPDAAKTGAGIEALNLPALKGGGSLNEAG